MTENNNISSENTYSCEETSEKLSEEQNCKNENEDISEIELITKQLEDEKSISAGYLDRLQRTLAEFDNFRKRSLTEKSQIYDNGTCDTIEKFLPIIDNFERAFSSISDEDKDNSLYKGIEMILNQFLNTFEAIGVSEVPSIGSEFNPSYHNAVIHIEDDTLGTNIVAEVLQKGYQLNNKVIRVAMVKVAN